MNLNIILEEILFFIININLGNIRDGFIVTFGSLAIIWIYNRFFNKIKTISKNKIENQFQYKDPLIILIFITSIFSIITFFSFIYNWQPFNFFMFFLSSIFFILIIFFREEQCPKCKKLGKVLDNKKILSEEKRPYRYRDSKETYYSDGTLKERKFFGELKTIMETWRTVKEYYKCKYCGHRWDETFYRNIDNHNRPKPDKKVIEEKNYNIG